jgi:hypothetical protein
LTEEGVLKEKLAEYWANVCLGYALVLFGANILEQWSAGSSGGRKASLVISGLLMVALLILGAWLAARSRSVEE